MSYGGGDGDFFISLFFWIFALNFAYQSWNCSSLLSAAHWGFVGHSKTPNARHLLWGRDRGFHLKLWYEQSAFYLPFWRSEFHHRTPLTQFKHLSQRHTHGYRRLSWGSDPSTMNDPPYRILNLFPHSIPLLFHCPSHCWLSGLLFHYYYGPSSVYAMTSFAAKLSPFSAALAGHLQLLSDLDLGTYLTALGGLFALCER